MCVWKTHVHAFLCMNVCKITQMWPEDSIGTGPYLRQDLLVVVELLYIRTQ